MKINLAIVAAHLFSFVYSAQFCTSDRQICLTTSVNSTDMTFEIVTSVSGWASVGFGKSMSDADVMLVYKKGSSCIVEDRYSKDESLPPSSAKQISKMITTTCDSNGGFTTFRFSRPLAYSDKEHRILDYGQSPMIWAVSTSPVTDAPGMHTDYGSYSIDLYSTQSVIGAGTNKWYLILHGIFMFIAWSICAPIAIFMARYLKASLGIWWFRGHIGLLIATVALTAVGFALAYVNSTSGHFQSIHEIAGLAIFIASVLQSILGQVIDKLFNPQRKSIPWYDKLHWWLGRVLVPCAIANTIYGIFVYGEVRVDLKPMATILMYVNIALTGLTLIIFIFAQFQIGQTHHQEIEEIHQSVNADDYDNMAYNYEDFGFSERGSVEYSTTSYRYK